ncbi:MAG: hypothetical protein AAF740_04315 [Bacteroidota bacterium]
MKKKLPLHLFFVFCCSLLTTQIWSQSNSPCTATALTVGTDCSGAVSGSLDGFSYNALVPNCNSFDEAPQGFYTFVATATNMTIEVDGNAGMDPVIDLLEGTSCVALTNIDCEDNTGSNGTEVMDATGLTIGDTYTIAVYDWFEDNFASTTFDICVYAPPPPANNDPCNATPLTVGTGSCTFSTHTNVGATDSGIGDPMCGNYDGGDVWFTAVVPASGHLIIEGGRATGGFNNGAMAIYSGTCGTLNFIECDDNSATASPNMPLINNNSLTPGSTIFIRFWERGNDRFDDFNICVQDGDIDGDEPCDTISLPLGASGTCSPSTFSTVGATNSGIADPGCGDYLGGDVWFEVTVPSSGHLIFEIDDIDFTDPAMAIYDGTCGTLNFIECDEDDGDGNLPRINNSDLTPGSTIYVRVWEEGNDASGDFEICVFAPETCHALSPLCTDAAFSFVANSTTPELDAEDDINPGNSGYECLGSSPNPSWYYLEVNQAGNLVFDITAATDVDFALWGPYTSVNAAQDACGSHGDTGAGGAAEVDCSFHPRANERAIANNVQVGEVYVLLVTNYRNEVQTITLATGATNTAQTDCSVVTCSPSVTAGTTPTVAMGNAGSNNYILCRDETLTITSNDDFILPPASDLRGLGYAVYACAPTTGDPDTDPCWTGHYLAEEDLTLTNSAASSTYEFILANPRAEAGVNGTPSGNTLFFAPITMDDVSTIADGGGDDNVGHDEDGDACFNQGTAIEVQYLNEITAVASEDCGTGEITITLSGGYPEAEGTASYTVNSTGDGTMAQSGAQGGTLTFTGAFTGDTVSISVTDDSNGCTFTFSFAATCPVPVNCEADAGTW